MKYYITCTVEFRKKVIDTISEDGNFVDTFKELTKHLRLRVEANFKCIRFLCFMVFKAKGENET